MQQHELRSGKHVREFTMVDVHALRRKAEADEDLIAPLDEIDGDANLEDTDPRDDAGECEIEELRR